MEKLKLFFFSLFSFFFLSIVNKYLGIGERKLRLLFSFLKLLSTLFVFSEKNPVNVPSFFLEHHSSGYFFELNVIFFKKWGL